MINNQPETMGKYALLVFFVILLVSSCEKAGPSMRFNDEVHHIVAISDLNSSYGSTDYDDEVALILAEIIQKKPDLVICTGDMIAAQKTTLSDQNIAEMWDAFDQKLLSPLSKAGIPVMFTVGNHDASKSPTFKRDQRFAKEFWQKQKDKLGIKLKNQETFPFYYSAEFENLYVISWDASGAVFSEKEWEWIKEELSNHSNQKATIILGHLPIYPVAKGRNRRGEYLAHGDSVLQLLIEHDVDAYFSGHHHAYYPGIRESVLLIANGALGEGPRMLIDSDLPAQKSYTEFRIDSAGNISSIVGLKPDGSMIDVETLPSLINGERGFVYLKETHFPEEVKRELQQDSLSAELIAKDLGYQIELSGLLTLTHPLKSDWAEVTIRSEKKALTGQVWTKKVIPTVENEKTVRFESTFIKEDHQFIRELIAFGFVDISVKESVKN